MQRVLVTGATGNVGSRVVRELLERGVPVRAFVRDPGKAAAQLGDHVEPAVGDFGDPGSMKAALDGVDGVFLACSNQPRQVEYETRVIDAAREMGVRRIVKLSARGAEIGSPVASGTGTPQSNTTCGRRAFLSSPCGPHSAWRTCSPRPRLSDTPASCSRRPETPGSR
jgi:nucleoside-diphosphate-sugar epimerase